MYRVSVSRFARWRSALSGGAVDKGICVNILLQLHKATVDARSRLREATSGGKGGKGAVFVEPGDPTRVSDACLPSLSDTWQTKQAVDDATRTCAAPALDTTVASACSLPPDWPALAQSGQGGRSSS